MLTDQTRTKDKQPQQEAAMAGGNAWHGKTSTDVVPNARGWGGCSER